MLLNLAWRVSFSGNKRHGNYQGTIAVKYERFKFPLLKLTTELRGLNKITASQAQTLQNVLILLKLSIALKI